MTPKNPENGYSYFKEYEWQMWLRRFELFFRPPNMAASYLAGSSSLAYQLDGCTYFLVIDLLTIHLELMMIILRDGRHLVGVMRSFDQFCEFFIFPLYGDNFREANIVLENTYERHFAGKKFGDIPLGLYIIRGENVVIAGELVSVVLDIADTYLLQRTQKEKRSWLP